MAVEGRGSKKCEEAGRQKEETQSMQSHEQFDHCKGKHCARFFLYSVFGFSLVFWRKCGTNQTASNMHPKSIQIPAWNTLLNAALLIVPWCSPLSEVYFCPSLFYFVLWVIASNLSEIESPASSVCPWFYIIFPWLYFSWTPFFFSRVHRRYLSTYRTTFVFWLSEPTQNVIAPLQT